MPRKMETKFEGTLLAEIHKETCFRDWYHSTWQGFSYKIARKEVTNFPP